MCSCLPLIPGPPSPFISGLPEYVGKPDKRTAPMPRISDTPFRSPPSSSFVEVVRGGGSADVYSRTPLASLCKMQKAAGKGGVVVNSIAACANVWRSACV